jgi:hypothetical protein
MDLAIQDRSKKIALIDIAGFDSPLIHAMGLAMVLKFENSVERQ